MIYDDFASTLQREYELFLFALTGRYLALTSAGVDASPHTILAVRKSALVLQGMFLEHANSKVREFVQNYPSARSDERVVAFLREISRMSDANIVSLTDRLRGAALNPQKQDDMHGAMGLLLQRQMATPTFKVETKSGRSYEAVGLMGTEARDFAYRTWIDNKLEWIAQTSDLAQVQYADPTHAGNGMVFSIGGETPNVPTFAQIEDEVFHYNAQAMVVPDVSS